MVAGDVFVENGVVVEVGTSLRAKKAETVDASNAIVMPGFVDTHRHVWNDSLPRRRLWRRLACQRMSATDKSSRPYEGVVLRSAFAALWL